MVFLIGYQQIPGLSVVYLPGKEAACNEITTIWWELKPFLMLKLSFVQKNCIASGHLSKNVHPEGQDYLIIFSLIVPWQGLRKLPANV